VRLRAERLRRLIQDNRPASGRQQGAHRPSLDFAMRIRRGECMLFGGGRHGRAPLVKAP
jgi:hypothetical protein